jgi:hypothetical protein
LRQAKETEKDRDKLLTIVLIVLIVAAMSKAMNSPTGRLLRFSRLFSLPPPLPAAPVESSTAGQTLRTSDTATQPYPTYQAISTPASSRSRGDWGLKRPLPSRSIPKNSPHLRIKAIDNLNHITDFESAADHTQTLAKWQDMNVPITLPPNARTQISDSSNKLRPSAFSEDYDNTTLQPHGEEQTTFTAERALRERGRQAAEVAKRERSRQSEIGEEDGPVVTKSTWKTQGPHLNDLTQEEFERYLMNLVRQHKPEFIKFLQAVKIEKKRGEQLSRMRSMSESDPQRFELELQHKSRVDAREMDDWIKELRDNHDSLNSELAMLVRDFFDLPAFPAPRATGGGLTSELTRPKSDAGPPSTHPSAGLSYMLTNAVVDNHPKYGPQSERSPVQARVLRTKNSARGRDNRADVGLGGFVTSILPGNVPGASRFKDLASRTFVKNPLADLDLSLTGGNKVWLQPKSAYIDEAGRVRLNVAEASSVSVDIKLGNPVQEVVPTINVMPGRMATPLDSGFPTNAKYGVGLPDERLRQARPRPFETTETDSKAGLQQIEDLARLNRKET